MTMNMTKYLILIVFLIAGFTANAKKVKFNVDMTGLPVNTTGIHISGDFQEEAGFEGGDWQSNTTEMLSEGGSAIYSVVVDIPAFAKYEYKFINGDQWYEVEFVPLESRVGYEFNDNRWVYVDSLYNDTTLIPAVLFSGNAPAGFSLLRLKVDMSQEGSLDPAGIHLAKDEQIGTGSSTIMYSFADSIYEQIIYAPVWTDYAECMYVFINGNTLEGYETVPQDCSVDGYRFVEMDKDTVMETVCFAECQACSTQFIADNQYSGRPRIYPNPCKQGAILEFNDPGRFHKVTMMDILGNVLRHFEDIGSPSVSIQRETLPAGIYFIRIENADHWLSTLRLVISDK
jgi:alpha-amylase